MQSCHSTNTAAQARRLCYFSLGVAPRAVTSCALDVSDSAQRPRLRIVADLLDGCCPRLVNSVESAQDMVRLDGKTLSGKKSDRNFEGLSLFSR